jgi:ribosome biogenesis protein NSA1
MTTIPTVVVWDQKQDTAPVDEDDQEGDDVWEGMKNAVEGDEKA